jgi:hypothetical protein
MSNHLRLLPFALLTSLALAQSPLDFQIDQAASAWSWSGNTSVGPLVGNPTQDFNLTGNFLMSVDSGALPIATAAFLPGGVAGVTPDISGKIPNPVPGFPPLAVVDITGLTLQFTSGVFPVDGAGNFATDVVVTALSGTLTVTPLAGSPTVTDLTGQASDPTPVTGVLTQSGGSLNLASLQSSTFNFVDPGSGISGSITLDGSLVGDYTCPAPINYCLAAPNSTGATGAIGWTGSTRIQDNSLTLTGGALPGGQFSYFLMSASEAFVPGFGGSQGNLCLGPPQLRFNALPLNTGGAGAVALTLDLTGLPQGTTVHPGEAWNFQLWYRDVNPMPTSNTTDALKVTFCP